jgi:hypothetical protein
MFHRCVRDSGIAVIAVIAWFAGLALVSPQLAHSQDWPAIARELEAMLEADQTVRREWNLLVASDSAGAVSKPLQADDAQRAALRARVQSMDAAHQARLAAIIAAHGWPRRADVGGRATMAAFTIVQHAPVEFQRKVFADAQRAAASDDIDRSALAALEDRIRVHDKRPQRFGTQVEIRNGGVTLWPVEDPTALDARRREVGLMPICAYLALFATSQSKVEYAPCVAPHSDAKPSTAPVK